MSDQMPSPRCRSRVQTGVRVGQSALAGALVVALLLTALPGRLASAQTTDGPTNVAPTGCTLSTTTATGTCIAGATSSNGAATAFNLVGAPDTVTLVCDAGVIANGLIGTSGAAIAPGCYDVTATVTDTTTDNAAPIQSATCGILPAATSVNGATCSTVASPICPVGTAPAPAPSTITPCAALPSAAGYAPENTMKVAINPGIPHPYLITFSGYTPTNASGSCLAGTTLTPAVSVTMSFGVPPVSTVIGLFAACQFSVSVQTKYLEPTVILAAQPIGATCGGRLISLPSLHATYGPACKVSGSVSGSVTLKTGVDCTTEPPNGTDANNPINGIVADFPPGSTYQCQNGTLSVVGIPVSGAGSLAYTITGPGSFLAVNTPLSVVFGRLGWCAGAPGGAPALMSAAAPVTICPTGAGVVQIMGYLVAPNGVPYPSNAISATYRP